MVRLAYAPFCGSGNSTDIYSTATQQMDV